MVTMDKIDLVLNIYDIQKCQTTCSTLFYWSIGALYHWSIISKGSAEDELGDGEAKYAKLRPMWVEMLLLNQTPARFLKPRRCLV